ncbi:MAG: helix-turn-helix transcriptional regulator [Lachnospiraceae bacterium]|nr:helix-turn-helix transcriptional regulator [Lachnospiraceae bacterium]
MEIDITINERITDLRTMSGLSQKELADRIDVPTSTLCRIEQGKISNVSNDVLIKLANFFNVSTDYLLGLTNVKFKKNVELSELGLTNKALFALLSGSVDGALLSRIIEHPHFVTLLDTADAYFKDAHKAGIQSRNDVINLATASLKDFMKEHPENRMEISHDIRQLNAEKIGGDEADMNKLRNIFMSILKDIKADYDNAPQDIEATEFQEMLAEIKTQSDDIQAKRPVTETDIANITASLLSGVDALDETETMMFYELSKHLLERMSNGTDGENGENIV